MLTTFPCIAMYISVHYLYIPLTGTSGMRYDMLLERVMEVHQVGLPNDGCNTGWYQSISTAETEVTPE